MADRMGHRKTDAVLKLIHSGQLPAVNISAGKRPTWRIDPADLEAFLARRRAVPAPAVGGPDARSCRASPSTFDTDKEVTPMPATRRSTPDPEWNRDPKLFDRAQWSKNYLDPLKSHDVERERLGFPKPPPDWGRVRPTAFPDIKAVGPKELVEFVARWTRRVLESDPPLRKLQKAKPRTAMDELIYYSSLRFGVGDHRSTFEGTMAAMSQVAREAVATGLELADRPEDRRAWLEFRVGLEKEHEATAAERVKSGLLSPGRALAARRGRLNAEIALQLHHERMKATAK